jgi:hypothetical protein
LIQCKHDYKASKNVEKGKYDDQGYNHESYCKEVTNLTSTSFFDMEQSNLPLSILPIRPTHSNNPDHQDDNDTDVVDDLSYPFDDNDNNEDEKNGSHQPSNLSYGKVIGKCTDLTKTIQNNPAEMTKLFVLMENMVKRY